MKEITETYVEIWYPGIIFAENDTVKVNHRSPTEIAEKYPDSYAFQFYDINSTTVVVDGKSSTVKGYRKNISPLYYPGGKICTKIDIASEFGESSILYSNMDSNKWDTIVKTRCGNYQEFNDKCEVFNV